MNLSWIKLIRSILKMYPRTLLLLIFYYIRLDSHGVFEFTILKTNKIKF